LASILVKTYAVKQTDKALKLLKKDYKQAVTETINGAPKRNKSAVFQIVALKTCRDAEILSKGSKNKSKSADIKPPVKEIVTAAAHGVPSPINPDVEVNLKDMKKATRDGSQVAKGERIFAVQYRLVRKRSAWSRSFCCG
jgi:hypothetical protein